MRKALICLSLLLLSVSAPPGACALHVLRPLFAVDSVAAEPIPYLITVGAPPLRFQEPGLSVDPSAPRALETAAANTTPPSADVAAEPQPVSSTPSILLSAAPGSIDATPGPEIGKATAPQAGKAPAPILPDDARPTIRPEDFLPYFQIPGSARHPADVTLLVPAPGAPPAPATLPPSSANYTQTPR